MSEDHEGGRDVVYVVARRHPDAVFSDQQTATRFAELAGLDTFDVHEYRVRDDIPQYVDVVTISHDVGQSDAAHATPEEDTRRIWEFEPPWEWATTKLPQVERVGRTIIVKARTIHEAWKKFREEAARTRSAYWDTPQQKSISHD